MARRTRLLRIIRGACKLPQYQPVWRHYELYQIRRVLTERAVLASDKRARFVGVTAHEAAGGSLLRGLFEEDGGGWLEDIALLERLVAEKLRTEAEAIAAKAGSGFEVAASFPYGHEQGHRRLVGTRADLTAEEHASVDALHAEYAALQEKYEDADELPTRWIGGSASSKKRSKRLGRLIAPGGPNSDYHRSGRDLPCMSVRYRRNA